jgi:uncharacterized membrane protein
MSHRPKKLPIWQTGHMSQGYYYDFLSRKAEAMTRQTRLNSHPPIGAGILLGLGLGGFFDGIVLHQILQWHHMLTSAGYPATSVGNLEVNTLWDGLFHATAYLLTVIGLFLLWRSLRRTTVVWSTRLLIGCLLVGWGLFNLVEGIIDHHLLGIHHVREGPNQLAWDLGFLAWGALMLVGGWLLMRAGRQEAAGPRTGHGPEARPR